MLKVFRDYLKYLSWVLWLVIAVFILFVFVDFGGVSPGQPSATVAVTVGKTKISVGEFQEAYRRTESFYRQKFGEQYTPQLAQQLQVPQQVLEGLIGQQLLLGEARRVGLRVTDLEVQQAILNEPSLQENGKFVGEEKYLTSLARAGLTPSDFENQIREQMLSEKLRTTLAQNIWVSDEQVEETYRKSAERAKIRYVRLPFNRYADQAAPAEEEIATYFDSNKTDFRIPEQRVASYLMVDLNEMRQSVEVSQEELEVRYQENLSDYQQEEQVQARHILLKVDDNRSDDEALALVSDLQDRIQAGEDFAALAEEFSDDPGSQTRGGDLGFFGRGQMVPEFEEAAFTTTPGTLADPVRTTFGYHLIEVLERRAGGQRPLASVEGIIRNQIASQKAGQAGESKAQELAERLSKNQPASDEELQQVADQDAGVSFQKTEAFGRDDIVPSIGSATAFSVAAFEAAAGETTGAVRIPRGWAILRVSEVQPPRLPTLDEVRGQVLQVLAEATQEQLARSALENAKRRIAEGTTMDDLAVELGLEIQESNEFVRDGSIAGLGNSAEIVNAALAMGEGEIGGPTTHDNAVVLYQVSERQHFDRAEFDQLAETTRETLEAEELDNLLTSILAARRDETKISYNTELLDSLSVFGNNPPAL